VEAGSEIRHRGCGCDGAAALDGGCRCGGLEGVLGPVNHLLYFVWTSQMVPQLAFMYVSGVAPCARLGTYVAACSLQLYRQDRRQGLPEPAPSNQLTSLHELLALAAQ
jgi:hypothetical protein